MLINIIIISEVLEHMFYSIKMANRSPFRCPKILSGPFRWHKSFSVFRHLGTVQQEGCVNLSEKITLAEELFRQKKSVLVVKTATYTFGGGENLRLFIKKNFPLSVNISLNKSDCEKPFGLFKVNVTCLNRLYFSINFDHAFLRFSTSKMINS